MYFIISYMTPTIFSNVIYLLFKSNKISFLRFTQQYFFTIYFLKILWYLQGFFSKWQHRYTLFFVIFCNITFLLFEQESITSAIQEDDSDELEALLQDPDANLNVPNSVSHRRVLRPNSYTVHVIVTAKETIDTQIGKSASLIKKKGL